MAGAYVYFPTPFWDGCKYALRHYWGTGGVVWGTLMTSAVSFAHAGFVTTLLMASISASVLMLIVRPSFPLNEQSDWNEMEKEYFYGFCSGYTLGAKAKWIAMCLIAILLVSLAAMRFENTGVIVIGLIQALFLLVIWVANR
ncbi:hypothetical protein HZB60_03020 [candidate division KSB1 bacterium]|nr:hypothetical protein [candidate division KSB1 bacterium]